MSISPVNEGDPVSASKFNNIIDSTNTAHDRITSLTPEHLNQQPRLNNIDFVVITQLPVENDKTLKVKTVKYSNTPALADGTYPLVTVESNPFDAFPQPGTKAIDYASLFYDEGTEQEPNPIDENTSILQMQPYQSRLVVWLAKSIGGDEACVVRGVGSGNDMFVTCQFVRYDNKSNIHLADGPVEQLRTWGELKSRFFEPFLLPIGVIDPKRIQDIKSLSGTLFVKQTFAFSLKKIPPNLPISECRAQGLS